MGLTYADITLANTDDEAMVSRGLLQTEQVRKVEIRALVDSGASTLVISDHLKNQLGLRVLHTTESELADGSCPQCEFVGPVSIYFKNRASICRAIMLPGTKEVLLGAIPIEDMDVIIDPAKQELALPPDRPYLPRVYIK
jgi:clan AA aspartic protease